ncbi:hypothetical protein EOT10_35710 [Streptomyces antnestii]|uniref:LigA protein n=1 Tax=Streptomyces antnestii TaxID=2494256 RepID=A0A437P3D1_9ACTN|nr:hypothetical protein [Streptomyces sp. San01]RVU16716.1 hypothetical protein EOT10_35710 [Streptomyces sp. San01]
MSGIQEDRDRDAFAGGLGEALRITGDSFDAPGGSLVEGGVARGRRRLRRRRAATVTGSVAALAVVGFGASYAAGAFGAGAVHGSPVAARPEPGRTAQGKTGASASGKQYPASHVIKTLEGLLPQGELTHRTGRGTDEDGGPFASVVFDDGKGKAAISVSLGRVDPEDRMATDQLACPGKVYTPYDACSSKTLADGTRLLLLQGYEYPDKRVDTKWWHAYAVTAEGYTIDAGEWNAPAEKDAPVSRDEPPLSAGQLKTLVTAEEWRPILRALPEPQLQPVQQPAPQAATADTIVRNLTSLLPKSTKVTTSHGDDGFAYVVVNDGKGASLVQINVQPDMKDEEGDLFGSDAQTRPDGMKVATHQGAGDKGVQGAAMWTVDTISKDGFRVVISAFNSGSQITAPTRKTPALTMDQLKAIATSEKWRG